MGSLQLAGHHWHLLPHRELGTQIQHQAEPSCKRLLLALMHFTATYCHLASSLLQLCSHDQTDRPVISATVKEMDSVC